MGSEPGGAKKRDVEKTADAWHKSDVSSSSNKRVDGKMIGPREREERWFPTQISASNDRRTGKKFFSHRQEKPSPTGRPTDLAVNQSERVWQGLRGKKVIHV